VINPVEVGAAEIERYRALVDGEMWSELESTMRELAAGLKGRTLWNVNSTAHGGGVAELLSALIPYERGAGIDERWVTIEGSPEFFAVTKKIHTLLHGVASDASAIHPDERAEYERTMSRNGEALLKMVRPKDVVVLHDPQTAGLAPALRRHGAHPVWRAHIGVDKPNDQARTVWDFLRPSLEAADGWIFSRRSYVWEGLDSARVHILPPCIDAFTPKNVDLASGDVGAILAAAELLEGSQERIRPEIPRITRRAVMSGPPLPPEARVVLQVSRWDRLKDPLGVMEGFARHIAPHSNSHLVLAGPVADSVKDDPEQPEVFAELGSRAGMLPPEIRDRVRIAQLPMEDEDENAVLVNALQRHAAVVVQKSFAEGFGLTVAEAMWKGRPVVASNVGGIEDQIEDQKSGILVEADDLEAFGRAVVGLLHDSQRAEQLGAAAKARVARHFLVPRHLLEQGRLISSLIS
jgi:trehalose synthase